jgi:tetratricopeptide (TPR) repeat protein
MSLLLDALQRASKDKEKAANAAGAPASAPTLTNAPTPELSLSAKEAQDEFVPLPVLVQAEPTPVRTPAFAPAQKLQPEPELSLAPELPTELALDLGPAPAQVQPPPQTPSPVFGAAFGVTSESAAQPALVSSSATPPSSAAVPAPAVASASPNPSRVAQDMRRAYAPVAVPAAGRRRALLIAGLAIALTVVVAGLLMKIWQGSASSVAETQLIPAAVQAPPPVAPVEQEVVANVQAAVPADIEQPLSSNPKAMPQPESSRAAAQSPAVVVQAVAVPAAPPAAVAQVVPVVPVSTTATTPNTEKSNDVQVQGGAAGKQTFASRTRGPSPLEVGYAALLAGRLDDASQHYAQALKANPEERDALLGLAYIAQKRDQREEAQALYRRVLRQEPGNAIASAALLGLDSQTDNSQTASRAKDLAMRQPDSAATMAMAGNAAVREGLLADAVQLFARAQFLEPANPLHAYNHAVALDRLGQFAAATAQYERVLKLSDSSASPPGRGYSPDVVKERLAQLRQALGTQAQPVK